MKLNRLLKAKLKREIEISGLTLDHRAIEKGELFFAYPGEIVDRRDFIADALENGAAAVLYDPDNFTLPKISEGACFPVENLQQKVGEIAARFYGNPSEDLLVIAVTGTNGKTSVSQLIAHSLTALGQKSAVIGTMGTGFLDQLDDASQTTPNPILVQKRFSELKEQGAKAVIMEASSHALEQGRLNGTKIDVALFTNLTHDHLDYHQTMDNYANAKKRLFDWPTLKHRIFNMDDDCGFKWVFEDFASTNSLGVSTKKERYLKLPESTLWAENIELKSKGMRLSVKWKDAVFDFTTHLIGAFNVENILLVVAALLALEYPSDEILKIMPMLPTVKGRMETIGKKNMPLFVIDFAHTPDALEKALMALKAECQGELIVLFGCGGDRDRTKREVMGKIADRLAQKIVLTDDNPRSENSMAIIKEIKKGIIDSKKVTVEPDRAKAIECAFHLAKAQDIILLAGKGHETYQIYQAKKVPLDERAIIENLIK